MLTVAPVLVGTENPSGEPCLASAAQRLHTPISITSLIREQYPARQDKWEAN